MQFFGHNAAKALFLTAPPSDRGQLHKANIHMHNKSYALLLGPDDHHRLFLSTACISVVFCHFL